MHAENHNGLYESRNDAYKKAEPLTKQVKSKRIYN